MSTIIKPTVGRVVHFTPASDDNIEVRNGQPLAAIISSVEDDNTVHLAVFDAYGESFSRTFVTLIQEDNPIPVGQKYCQWMPFQRGQAALTQQAEAALAGLIAIATDHASALATDQAPALTTDQVAALTTDQVGA